MAFSSRMDPLTHTLVGANLSATRLGETTRFAAAALILGANAPDIDAVTYFMDSDLALGVRRGWTHGIAALVVLPFVLAGLLALVDKVHRGKRPFRFAWVLTLSTIGVWTHPFLDWLNTYGMRWLMPFDGTWFYGDAVYIMDPWLWLVLGVGWLGGRRPTIPLFSLWLFFALALARIVARRSPEHLIILAAIAVILLAALLWRGASKDPLLSRRIAAGALVIASLYIGARLTISGLTASYAERELRRRGIAVITEAVMVSPEPIDPTRWRFVAPADGEYRFGTVSWMDDPRLNLATDTIPMSRPSPECAAARQSPDVQGFVTWARFPICEVEHEANRTVVHLYDARSAGRGRGLGARTVMLKPSR